MKLTRMDRKKLLAVVKKNRETHLADYAEAIVEYRKQSQIKLQEALDKRNETLDSYLGNTISISLPVPLNMVEQYDEIISQLEFSADKIIELSQQEFQNYVLDKWSAAAKASSAFYTGKGV